MLRLQRGNRSDSLNGGDVGCPPAEEGDQPFDVDPIVATHKDTEKGSDVVEVQCQALACTWRAWCSAVRYKLGL